jgi:hypothetical protein
MAQRSRISPVRFAPSRVEGLAAIHVVEVHVDRIELSSPSAVQIVRFSALAPRNGLLARLLRTLQGAPTVVGDRDWCCSPPDRFFRFGTVTIHMPTDDPTGATFQRVREVMLAGGLIRPTSGEAGAHSGSGVLASVCLACRSTFPTTTGR